MQEMENEEEKKEEINISWRIRKDEYYSEYSIKGEREEYRQSIWILQKNGFFPSKIQITKIGPKKV